MATIRVCAEHTVEAPASAVYGYIADMREHHPHFLPPAFADFHVESGGVAALAGVRVSIVSGGVLCVAGVIVAAFALPGFWRYDARTQPPT